MVALDGQKTMRSTITLDIEMLRQVPVFSKLPDDRLCWLMEQGKEVWVEPGQFHRREGDPADHVFVLLDGEVRIARQEGNQEVLLVTYTAKTLYGELPILTGDQYFWASGQAITSCHILELSKDVFWQLLASCSCVTTAILSTMAKRMQEVQELSQHREKMVALGTLAAGLAHELNNPASAAQRAARRLRETFQSMQSINCDLNQQLTPEQKAFLAEVQQEAIQRATTATLLDSITQSDREDELSAWLNACGVENCWRLAPTLVAAGLDIDWLKNVAEKVPKGCFNDVLTWLEATLGSLGLLDELDHCTDRISSLVKSVKDYSYMDQAPLQEVDIHAGLESTLTMLSNKIKQGVTILRDYDQHLPRITAYGSELNQVWTNLLDNAIDAVQGAKNNGKASLLPTVHIRTRCESSNVLVEVIDNGPGIPANVQSHIFEPFFTTKGVGQGTGLGLHIAYRIVVGQHRGDIRVFSEPGNTRFQVRLPLQSESMSQ
jgi:signal transduction histidine kinase